VPAPLNHPNARKTGGRRAPVKGSSAKQKFGRNGAISMLPRRNAWQPDAFVCRLIWKSMTVSSGNLRQSRKKWLASVSRKRERWTISFIWALTKQWRLVEGYSDQAAVTAHFKGRAVQ